MSVCVLFVASVCACVCVAVPFCTCLCLCYNTILHWLCLFLFSLSTQLPALGCDSNNAAAAAGASDSESRTPLSRPKIPSPLFSETHTHARTRWLSYPQLPFSLIEIYNLLSGCRCLAQPKLSSRAGEDDEISSQHLPQWKIHSFLSSVWLNYAWRLKRCSSVKSVLLI